MPNSKKMRKKLLKKAELLEKQAHHEALLRTSNQIQGVLREHKIPYKCRVIKKEYYGEKYLGYSRGQHLPKIREVFSIVATLPGDDYRMYIRVEEDWRINTEIWWYDNTHLEFTPALRYMKSHNNEEHYRIKGFKIYLEEVLRETDGLLFKEYSRLIEIIEVKCQREIVEDCFMCKDDEGYCICSPEKANEREKILEKPLKEELEKTFKNSIQLVCGEGKKKPEIAVERKQVDDRNWKVDEAVSAMKWRIKNKYIRILNWDSESDQRNPSGYYDHHIADYDW